MHYSIKRTNAAGELCYTHLAPSLVSRHPYAISPPRFIQSKRFRIDSNARTFILFSRTSVSVRVHECTYTMRAETSKGVTRPSRIIRRIKVMRRCREMESMRIPIGFRTYWKRFHADYSRYPIRDTISGWDTAQLYRVRAALERDKYPGTRVPFRRIKISHSRTIKSS